MPVCNEAHLLPRTLERLSALQTSDPLGAHHRRRRLDRRGRRSDRDRWGRRARAGSRDSKPSEPREGAAIRLGFWAAEGDILGVQDADLEYDPADISGLLVPLLEGRGDAAFGTRTRGEYKPYSVWYGLGNRFLGLVATVLFGRFVTDLYTCYKFMTRPAYERLQLTADGFAIEAEISARLFLSNARIVEVPVFYRARSREAGKKLRESDGVRGLVRLVRVRIGR